MRQRVDRVTEFVAARETDDAVLRGIEDLIARQRRVEALAHRQQTTNSSRQRRAESLLLKQHATALEERLAPLPASAIAHLLEALPQDDGLLVWELVAAQRGDEILACLDDVLRQTLKESRQPRQAMVPGITPQAIHLFELQGGRLRQIQVDSKEDLAATRPIWVDLLAPSKE